MVPDNIMKLLRSAIPADIVLGVIWCKNNLGEEWMLKNFTFIVDIEKQAQRFPVRWEYENVGYYMKIGDLRFILGPICIQAAKKEELGYLDRIRIDWIYKE